MNATSGTTALTGVKIDHSGMGMHHNYSFSLKTTDASVILFSARYFSKGRPAEVYDVVVPTTVMEELSEIVRAAGNPGEPSVKGAPPSKLEMRDYSTWSYRLYWADGTETGAGPALNQIVKYLHALAEKHVEKMPLGEKWDCPCGASGNTKPFCINCGRLYTKL